jgi:hypothetical protein
MGTVQRIVTGEVGASSHHLTISQSHSSKHPREEEETGT